MKNEYGKFDFWEESMDIIDINISFIRHDIF